MGKIEAMQNAISKRHYRLPGQFLLKDVGNKLVIVDAEQKSE